ncbi:MAG: VOC family protein [Geminicoccaceae bacterium]|nr:VOC family protein [Geminicoccaceae bacterium]
MALGGLDHVNIRVSTDRLKPVRDFYVDLLGLQEGERPPFPFPGHWLYLGGQPVIHLAAREGLEVGTDTGGIDHVAFSAHDLASMRARLEQQGVAFDERTVPLLGLHQLFITDPAGVKVELNFQASEAA